MAKTANTSGSATVRVTLSNESLFVLEQLASQGVYGRNPAEVAGRFIDRALQEFIEQPKIKLPKPSSRARKGTR